MRSALPTVHTIVYLKTRFSPGAATRSRRGRAARGPGRSIRAIRLEFSGPSQVSWLVPWLLCTRAVTVHTVCTPEEVRLLSARGRWPSELLGTLLSRVVLLLGCQWGKLPESPGVSGLFFITGSVMSGVTGTCGTYSSDRARGGYCRAPRPTPSARGSGPGQCSEEQAT